MSAVRLLFWKDGRKQCGLTGVNLSAVRSLQDRGQRTAERVWTWRRERTASRWNGKTRPQFPGRSSDSVCCSVRVHGEINRISAVLLVRCDDISVHCPVFGVFLGSRLSLSSWIRCDSVIRTCHYVQQPQTLSSLPYNLKKDAWSIKVEKISSSQLSEDIYLWNSKNYKRWNCFF